MSNTITVDATAYALLTAVELGHTSSADKIACWLTTQENYFGGFKSSQVTGMLDWELFEPKESHMLLMSFFFHAQDTMMALEALAEYELKRDTNPDANLIAEFRVSGKTDILKLALEKKKDKVETDLKVSQSNVSTTLK